MRSSVADWLRFNAVGAAGAGVQLAALVVFRRELHLADVLAVALAVECAILHNFVWHERWTWRARALDPGQSVRRLLRFHAGNGAASLLVNVGLAWALVSEMHLHYLVSNAIAIAGCSVLNFWISDHLVFRKSPRPGYPGTPAAFPEGAQNGFRDGLRGQCADRGEVGVCAGRARGDREQPSPSGKV